MNRVTRCSHSCCTLPSSCRGVVFRLRDDTGMPEKRTSGPLIKGSNAVVDFLVDRVGLNLAGAEVLEVRGRTSGTPYRIPVNPVEVDGIRYLFSPRGETGWVKNIRVS